MKKKPFRFDDPFSDRLIRAAAFVLFLVVIALWGLLLGFCFYLLIHHPFLFAYFAPSLLFSGACLFSILHLLGDL